MSFRTWLIRRLGGTPNDPRDFQLGKPKPLPEKFEISGPHHIYREVKMEQLKVQNSPPASKAKRIRQTVDSMVGLPDSLTRPGHVSSGNLADGTVTYNWTLHRDGNKRWHFMAEWVDLDGDGHRVLLPHEVVTAMNRAIDKIHDDSRSLGAQKAFHGRKND